MKINCIFKLIKMTCSVLVMAIPAMAEDEGPTQILITNVNVYDGTSDVLAMKQDVLVEGKLRFVMKDGVVYKNRL